MRIYLCGFYSVKMPLFLNQQFNFGTEFDDNLQKIHNIIVAIGDGKEPVSKNLNVFTHLFSRRQ